MVPTFPHAQVQSRNVSTITASTSAPWIRQTNLRCLSMWDLHLGQFAPYMCSLHLLMGLQSHPVVPLILNLFVPPPIKVDATFTNDMVGVHTSYPWSVFLHITPMESAHECIIMMMTHHEINCPLVGAVITYLTYYYGGYPWFTALTKYPHLILFSSICSLLIFG